MLKIKKIIAISLILLIVPLTGCRVQFAVKSPDFSEQPDTNEELGNEESDIDDTLITDELPFDGKIVIVTNTDTIRYSDYYFETIDAIEDEFVSVEALTAKYGPERVIHRHWPYFWDPNGEEIIDSIFRDISEDPEVRAAVLMHSIPYPEYSYVEKSLQNIRDDIFVVYIPLFLSEREEVTDIKADMIIQTDAKRMGEAYVKQAVSMGADTIVYYSSPWFRSIPTIAKSRETMMAAAEQKGVKFFDFDVLIEGGSAMGPYLTHEMTRLVESLGNNIAFYSSHANLQSVVLSLVSATGAIFVQTDEFLSPFIGYPVAFEIEYRIETGEENELGQKVIRRSELPELLQSLDEAVDAAGMSGRISSWAVPERSMWITIGFMYAVEWLSGNVPQRHGVIDIETLEKLAREYSAQFGLETGASFEAFTDDEGTIGHYILGIIDYYVFGR